MGVSAAPLLDALSQRLAALAPHQIAIELVVRESELLLVGLPGPHPGGRRLLDNRAGNPQMTRQLSHVVFYKVTERQQIDSPVAVLGEIAERQLRTVAGAQDEVPVASCEVVERRHAETRFDVVQRQVAVIARRLLSQSRGEAVKNRVETDLAMLEMEGLDQQFGVLPIARIGVDRHGHREVVVAKRSASQDRHRTGVDSSGQTEDESLATRRLNLGAQPVDQAFGEIFGVHRDDS